jgi:hypothetical protein
MAGGEAALWRVTLAWRSRSESRAECETPHTHLGSREGDLALGGRPVRCALSEG